MFWHQYSQLGPLPSAVSVSECLPLPSKEAGAVSVPSLHSDLISGHSLESMSRVPSLQNGPNNSRVPDTTCKLTSLENWPGAIAKYYVKSREVNVCLRLFLSRNLFFRRKRICSLGFCLAVANHGSYDLPSAPESINVTSRGKPKMLGIGREPRLSWSQEALLSYSRHGS